MIRMGVKCGYQGKFSFTITGSLMLTDNSFHVLLKEVFILASDGSFIKSSMKKRKQMCLKPHTSILYITHS